MINPQKPVINPIKIFNRFTALINTHTYIYIKQSTKQKQNKKLVPITCYFRCVINADTSVLVQSHVFNFFLEYHQILREERGERGERREEKREGRGEREEERGKRREEGGWRRELRGEGREEKREERGRKGERREEGVESREEGGERREEGEEKRDEGGGRREERGGRGDMRKRRHRGMI